MKLSYLLQIAPSGYVLEEKENEIIFRWIGCTVSIKNNIPTLTVDSTSSYNTVMDVYDFVCKINKIKRFSLVNWIFSKINIKWE